MLSSPLYKGLEVFTFGLRQFYIIQQISVSDVPSPWFIYIGFLIVWLGWIFGFQIKWVCLWLHQCFQKHWLSYLQNPQKF